MSHINKTTGYALLAAGYIAQHSQEGTVEATLISEQCNIPLLYLFKVLGKLIKANILHSKRGPGGGFTLARPAKDIPIMEIIEAVGGPLVNYLQLSDDTNYAPFILKMEKACQSAIEKATEIYGKAKLSDMVNHER